MWLQVQSALSGPTDWILRYIKKKKKKKKKKTTFTFTDKIDRNLVEDSRCGYYVVTNVYVSAGLSCNEVAVKIYYNLMESSRYVRSRRCDERIGNCRMVA